MARIIYVNGSSKEVVPENGTDFSLKELQSFVGGHIEIVFLDDGLMVVNDSGKLMGHKLNVKATDYLLSHSRYDDYIVGDALVCDNNQIK